VRKLFFITSNRAKLMHARHLAKPFDIEIAGKRNYGIAYVEPRSSNRIEILQRSYEDALARWRKTSTNDHGFFFIEDTSVIIQALSKDNEYPGVDVKYWMRSTDFETLDALLRKSGQDRTVTVRSDVILHLPEEFRSRHSILEPMLHFVGKTRGVITKKEPRLKTNLVYPWLDDRSFNKWFIPEGCTHVISAMPIAEADFYDIRRDSVGAMLKFLADRNALQDSPRVREATISKFLPHLFPPVSVITGLPCAGKTTLGEHLSRNFGHYHIEASDFMKRAFYERHGLNSSYSIELFAEEALKDTPGIVVSQVVEEIDRTKAELVAVTGFRSSTEVELFLHSYRGPSDVECLFIDADQETRYQRSVVRGRDDLVESFTKFRKRDILQLGMGLREVREMRVIKKVVNNGILRNFLRACIRMLSVTPMRFMWPLTLKGFRRPVGLEDTILLGLAWHERKNKVSLTTTEIAHKLNQLFGAGDSETSKNNVSRYFNFRVHAYYNPKIVEGVIKYKLSATGRSRAFRLAAKHGILHALIGIPLFRMRQR
jgi:inosine/xanthosine triphosphate pyrophosphatase family protein/adenylate kinase family enzyme